MADEPTPPNAAPPLPGSEQGEIVISPSSDPPIVADTAHDADYREDGESSRVTAQGKTNGGVFVYEERRQQTRFRSGPLPDPEMLQEYAQIYPNAPKMIFDEFKAQSSHRRDLEKLSLSNHVVLSRRGQIIGGALGAIGLTGSLVVAGLGQGWAGFGIAIGSLGSLISLFIYGQEKQKRELRQKEEIRQRIKEKIPVEDLEDVGPSKS